VTSTGSLSAILSVYTFLGSLLVAAMLVCSCFIDITNQKQT